MFEEAGAHHDAGAIGSAYPPEEAEEEATMDPRGAGASASAASPETPGIEQEDEQILDGTAGEDHEPTRTARASRRRFEDACAQVDTGPQWTQWDVGKSLQDLRSAIPGKVQRTLRRLHVRLWHAPAQRMRDVLSAAGLPKSVIDQVQPVVDTCSVCRTWQRHGDKPQASLHMTQDFNEGVQLDLLFLNDGTVVHMVDLCIKWAQARFVNSREPEEVLPAIVHLWFRQCTPPKYIESDQEGALFSDEGATWADRWGVALKPKPRGAHAHVIERRNEVLRQQYHRVREQADQDGIKVTKEELLDESVMALNCMLSVHGTTPYAALFGRVPNLLIEVTGKEASLDDTSGGNTSRYVHRIRELSLATVIRGNAEERLRRADSTRTRPAGQLLDLAQGDKVDFYRNPPNKDLAGWRGPGEVESLRRLDEGIIDVRWQGRILPCRVPDVRRSVIWLTFLVHPGRGDEVQYQYILVEVENLPVGSTVLFGFERGEDQQWRLSPACGRQPRLYDALMFWGKYRLKLGGLVAARIGHGTREIPPSRSARQSLILWWPKGKREEWSYACLDPRVKTLTHSLFGPLAGEVVWIQYLAVSVAEVEETEKVPALLPGTDRRPPPLNLSQTFKEYEEDKESRGATKGGDTPRDEELGPRGRVHPRDWEGDRPERQVPSPTSERSEWTPSIPGTPDHKRGASDDELEDSSKRPRLWGEEAQDEWQEVLADDWSFYAQVLGSREAPDSEHYISDFMAGEHVPHLVYDDGELELEFSRECALLVVGLLDKDIPDSRSVLLRMFLAHGSEKPPVKKLIEREADALTPQQKREHLPEVHAAMKNELQKWTGCEALAMRKLEGADNLMSAVWVLRWKKTPEGSFVIRARLCIRGFQDLQQDSLSTFSGTASRQGQRLVNYMAANREDFILSSCDVGSAFLKGLTFEQVAKMTGRPKRTVQLRLPAESVVFLRMIPGFERFDPNAHCLEMLRPGFGLKDAPRLWNQRVGQTMTRMKIHGTVSDPQLYCKWVRPPGLPLDFAECQTVALLGLMMLCSAHVDDFKMAASEEVSDGFMDALEEEFGPLTRQKRRFEHCGIWHEQLQDRVECSQDHYVKQLRTIDMPKGSPEYQEVDEATQASYWSLVGGVAWTTLTRGDVPVNVGHLQRQVKKPLWRHVKQVNSVVRWMKRTPCVLTYRPVPMPWAMITFPDSAYRAMEVDCLALRAAVVLVANEKLLEDGGGRAGTLEYFVRKQARVCRSTFAAELAGFDDGTSIGLVMQVMLVEVLYGPLQAAEIQAAMDGGRLPVKLQITADNRGLFSALAAEDLKRPAEPHLMYLMRAARDRLESGTIDRIWWVDTRDMISDVLTKGTVSKAAILKLWRTSELWIVGDKPLGHRKVRVEAPRVI